jgi:hypothetical protein
MPKLHQAELRSINYGHFGIPLYSPALKTWAFSRLVEGSARFVQLGNVEELAPGTGSAKQELFLRDEVDDREERYDVALESEIRQLVVCLPEVQPAELLIKPMVRLSEGIAHALAEHDPAAGDLLGIGNTSRTLEHGVDTIKLLAIPGGECGEALRLIRLHDQDYTFDDEIDFSIDEPTGEVGWWTGKGAPILQVRFAKILDKEEKNALLAVRLQGCIVMMYPRYRARPVPAPGIKLPTPPACSRIDSNVLFELSPRKAQGIQYADVSFNPWNQREFAVIDQAGQWATFAIERKSERLPVYEPKVLRRGQMPAKEDKDEAEVGRDQQGQQERISLQEGGVVEEAPQQTRESSSDDVMGVKSEALASASEPASLRLETISLSPTPDETILISDGEYGPGEGSSTSEKVKLKQDGWARITWVFNKTKVIICARKDIYVVDLPSGECFDLPALLPKSSRSAGWHLDLRLCFNHPAHIFVLTSNSIFLLRISQDASSGTASERVCKGTIVISALHFRDQADISLRLDVKAEGNNYLVTIYSQYNKIATCFRFEMPSATAGQASVSEAIPLILPEGNGGRTLAIAVNTVRASSYPEGSVPSCKNDIDGLHNIQFLGRDFGLRHAFFLTCSYAAKEMPPSPQRVGNVTTPDNISKRFIVPDTFVGELVSEEDDESDHERITPNTLLKPKRNLPQLQYRPVAYAVEGPHDADAKDLLPSMGIGDVSANIQRAIHQLRDGDGPQRTLFEHTDQAIPQVDDLRDASFELEDTFACSTSSSTVRLYTQAIPLPLAEDASEEMPFDDVHAHLEENYVAPLRNGFPNAFVQQREELTKSIAAEIVLASSRIEYTSEVKEENNQGKMEDVEMGGIFVGASQQTEALSQGKDEREGRSVFPTPSATGSRASRSRSPFTVPVNETMNEILQRLQRNVTLNVKQTQQWSLKPIMILNHWDLGADPEDYSYGETKKRLEEERSFVNLSEREQRKMLRRQERDQIRKQREARRAERLTQEISQTPTILSSQVPGINSQAPALGQSQVPAISSQVSSIRASQSLVPGFGSQASNVKSSQKPAKTRSQKTTPGFGSQPLPTPSRSKSVPGFGSSHATVGSSQLASQVLRKDAGGKGAKKDKTLANTGVGDNVDGQNQTFQIPVRPTAAVAGPSQPSMSQVSGSQRSIVSSQKPAASQSPSQRFASQVGGSQTPRKKKRRAEGF